MSLFNFFRKKGNLSVKKEDSDPEEDAQKIPQNVGEFENSHSFRGYKMIPLSIYGDPECDKNLPEIKRKPNGEIGEAHISLNYASDGSWEGIVVQVNDKKIGTFYNHEWDGREYLFKAIVNREIDSAHVRIEEGDLAVSVDDNGAYVYTERPKVSLFVHLIEQNK